LVHTANREPWAGRSGEAFRPGALQGLMTTEQKFIRAKIEL
jgi:hypothetical protein